MKTVPGNEQNTPASGQKHEQAGASEQPRARRFSEDELRGLSPAWVWEILCSDRTLSQEQIEQLVQIHHAGLEASRKASLSSAVAASRSNEADASEEQLRVLMRKISKRTTVQLRDELNAKLSRKGIPTDENEAMPQFSNEEVEILQKSFCSTPEFKALKENNVASVDDFIAGFGKYVISGKLRGFLPGQVTSLRAFAAQRGFRDASEREECKEPPSVGGATQSVAASSSSIAAYTSSAASVSVAGASASTGTSAGF